MSSDQESLRIPVLFSLGWNRWLPTAFIEFDGLLHQFPSITRAEAVAAQKLMHARQAGHTFDDDADPVTAADGLPASPAWEADPVEGIDDPQERAEVLADHERRIAEYDALTDGLGITAVRTGEQVLDLMIRLGLVVEEEPSNPAGGLRLAADPPLPTEALPMTAEAKAKEDKIRWHFRYAGLSQRVIGLFLDGDGGFTRTTLTVTLDRLAAQTDSTVDDVREAVLVLLGEGDFTVSRQGIPADVERLQPHQRFDLMVDPERFAATRMSVHLDIPTEKPDA